MSERRDKIKELMRHGISQSRAIDCLHVSKWDNEQAIELYYTMPKKAVDAVALKIAKIEMSE